MSCPAGSYCPSNSTEHITCPMGSYCPANASEPITCPAGTYCPIAGLSKPVSSPPGTFIPHTGATSVKDTTICPIGSYCPTGSASATPCPAGSFCTITGNSEIISRNTTATSFKPSDVPGLTLWFDANDFNSTNPSSWKDKTGKFTATCPFYYYAGWFGWNYMPQPSISTVNTKPAVSLNGINYFIVDDIPAGTFSDKLIILFVYQVEQPPNPNTPSTKYCAPVTRSASYIGAPLDQYNSDRYIDGSWFPSKYSHASSITPTLFTQLLNVSGQDSKGNTYYEYLNGNTEPSATSTFKGHDTATKFYIGTRADFVTRFKGNICEVLVYNTSITLDQQQRLEGYLAHKWGITANLPDTHPYKNTSPINNFVNCVVSGWTPWSECSATCGGGTQTQTRQVTTPAANGGTACPALTQSQPCNTQPCPVDCQVSAWSEWSECSLKCGGGTQTQTRTVTQSPLNGGAACPVLSQEQACNTQVCPVDCVLTAWSDWGPCSATCGGGTQTQTRTVTQTERNGGVCPILSQSQTCNTQACPSACLVSEWSNWSECNSVTNVTTLFGPGADFNKPFGIAIDSTGNVYIADTYNNKIKKITPTSTVTIGSGKNISVDGTGIMASFSTPYGVAVDSKGNMYVSDTYSNKIRKITPDGVVTNFAGGSPNRGSNDGTGTEASFNIPSGIAVDKFDNVYVADFFGHKIRKIDTNGKVITLAGSGTIGSDDYNPNNPTKPASFYCPFGVTVDSNLNVYVTEFGNNKIRKITSSGVVSTLAGSGLFGSEDGTGAVASFNYPLGITVDNVGTVYIADSGNNKIRKITSSGVVSTLSGSVFSGSTDGTVSSALFSYPIGITIDNQGNLYVTDTGNNKIRKITPYGVQFQTRTVTRPADIGGAVCPILTQYKQCFISFPTGV